MAQKVCRSETVRAEAWGLRCFIILFLIVAGLFFGCFTARNSNAGNGKLVIRVGSEVEFPPFALVDKSGLPTGFSVDLIKAVADASGLSIVFETGNWDTMWNRLVSGKLDVLPIVAKSYEERLTSDDSWLKYLLLAFLLSAAIALIAVFWSAMLGRLVRRPTAELATKNEELEQEIVVRKRVEEELRNHRENLEILIEERTRELRESEERFRRTFDESPVGSAMVSPDYRFLRVNEALCTITGYSAQELTALKFPDITHPDDIDDDVEHIRRLAEGEIDQYDKDKRYIRKDGDIAWVRTSVRLLRNQDGEPLYFLPIMQDITDRKKAEEALRRSESRHRNLVEHLPQRIFIKDRNSVYMSCNGNYAADLGITPEQIAGKDDFAFYPPELAQAYRADDQVCMTTEMVKDIEEPYLLAGQPRWARTIRVPYRDGQGQVIGVLGIFEDVTERKKIEDAQSFLLQSGYIDSDEDFFESLARYLAESLGMFYVCIDRLLGDGLTAQTLAVYCDGRFEDNLEYALKDTPCGDVVGKMICCFPRDVRHLFPKDVVLQEMMAESYVGTTLWSSKGQPIGLIAVIGRQPLASHHLAESILKVVAVRAAGELERRQAEAALRESRSLLDLIINALPVGITYVDNDGRFQFSNKTHRNWCGLRVQEAGGRTYAEMLGEGYKGAIEMHVQEALAGKEVCYETTLTYKDGVTRCIEVTYIPHYGSDGHFGGFISLIADCTERKAAEERQKQLADELQRFTYIVSHDLRGPLANIRGFLKELESALGELRPAIDNGLVTLAADERQTAVAALQEDIPESIHFINSSVTTMNDLVERVLQLSRVGRVDLVFQPLNMNGLIATVLGTLAHEIHEKGIAVEVAPLPQIKADRTSMEQIMSNLLGNAIKYREADRPLKITVTGQSFPHESVFVVRDDGRGIEQGDLCRIFDAFQRVGKLGVSGEGMGLAYVRTLVRRHGGRIWCESEPGIGSSFTFTISHNLVDENP